MTYKIQNVIKNIKKTLEKEKKLRNNRTSFNLFLKAFKNETSILNTKKQKEWIKTFIELEYIKREEQYIIFLDKDI